MAYEVLARKWRPQRFDDVLGQRAVTQTLRNAITSGRLAQAFVFAGPRGVGKTTTARILARALNCAAHDGPTADPCGACDACIEIAQGRDMDVLEIDAATHTQVDTVREVIIETLAIRPVRDRCKIFIIDEVHQLSNHSFNALLKSIEEPPPHVVFMMATTELRKIPDTILSRSQVFEFKAITNAMIAGQLRRIAQEEGIAIDEGALALIARAAEGSLRDATSAMDQVVAFAGTDVTADAVSTVLGLVGRDLLLDIVEAVAAEDQAAVFELAGRAAEDGYDLRQVCRELSRLVRDFMVVAIDPGRIDDPEIAQEGDRERIVALGKRFSREDLLRSFDVLSHADAELRGSAHPRYTFEMALLRWIHMRQLVPLAEIIQQLEPRGGAPVKPAGSSPAGSPGTGGRPAPKSGPAPASRAAAPPAAVRNATPPASARNTVPPSEVRDAAPPPDPAPPPAAEPPAASGGFADAFLAEVRQQNRFLYGSVVSQAQTIEADADRIVFTFAPHQRALRTQFDTRRSWFETVAARIGGRPVTVLSVESAGASRSEDDRVAGGPGGEAAADSRQEALRASALEDESVQALLDVFPAEITGVEEVKD